MADKPKNSTQPFGSFTKKTDEPAQVVETRTIVPAPVGVDKAAWAEAEAAVLAKNGGFAGVSPEGRKNQVQEAYNQIADQKTQSKPFEA